MNAWKSQSKNNRLLTRLITAALVGLALSAAAASAVTAQQKPARANPKETTLASTTPQAGEPLRTDGVAAIVNDSVISKYDVNQRLALFMATSGTRPPPEQMEQIRAQILKQLITERLQLQEARHQNISVGAADVDKAIENILKENHLKKEQLQQMLDAGGVAMATLRGQIATEIAWSKTVQAQFSDRVNITAADVNEEMRRIAEGANKPHFLVAEIFLAVDSPEQDDKVRKDAQDLVNQLRAGAPFNAVARQFSQNPSAAQGGDIGWVHEGQLQPELNEPLTKMRPGEVSEPIRSTGGYYILALRERQEGAGTKIPEHAESNTTPPGTLPLARILLPTGPKPAKDLLENAMKAASLLRQHLGSCADAAKVPSAVQGAVYMNLGTMKLADLSQQMQSELAKTQPGGVTDPFLSPAGVELIVRCDKAAPKITAFQMPTRQQVEQQLFEDQVTMLARQYMRDLRRNADVETR
jgi:peptidyl-prolyl cis-trans isomerase SurA